MSLYDMIAEKEKRVMEYYIDNYAMRCSSSEYSIPDRIASIKNILIPWEEAKSKYLANPFVERNSLILEKEIDFSVSEREMVLKLSNAPEYNNFYHSLVCKVDRFYNAFYEDFDMSNDERMELYRQQDSIYYMLNPRSMVENVFGNETVSIRLPNSDKNMTIHKGEKIMRALHKLAKAYDVENDFEALRLTQSRILNTKNTHGTLCLSVHPLDYMTMSDNASGWSSCMSWIEGGCYCQGTVEMMNSPCVVVAYLSGSEDMNFGRFSWNNKKWRELFIVDKNVLCGIKGYPYKHTELEKIVCDWLKELYYPNEDMKFVNKYEHEGTLPIFEDADVRISFETCNMYNDLASSDADPCMYVNVNIKDNVHHHCSYRNEKYGIYYLNYSGYSECLACGDVNCEFENEGCLVGSCCDAYNTCEYCDCHMSPDESCELDGSYYCRNCYESFATEDDLTGEIHHSDNCVIVYPGNDKGYYYDTGMTVYNENVSIFFKNLHKVRIERPSHWNSTKYAYFCFEEDMSEEAKNWFEENSYREYFKEVTAPAEPYTDKIWNFTDKSWDGVLSSDHPHMVYTFTK